MPMFGARQEGESYLRKVISRFCSGASSAISPLSFPFMIPRPRALDIMLSSRRAW